MSEHWSKDDLHCIHCGSVSNLSHYPSCPNYGLYDNDGYPIPAIDAAMSRHPAGKKLIKENLMFEPVKYVRKPFYVDAAKVTEENITEVARWCDGKILIDDAPYIKVKVKRPLAERQTRAFVGDWVLSSGNGYKVYTQASFEKNFEDVGDKITLTRATNEQLELLIEKLDAKLNS